MRALQAVFVALAAAVMLTSVASAGADATKQRVEINMKICCSAENTFVLTPLQAGALKRDSGTHGCNEDQEIDLGEVLRDGQEIFRYECRAWVFTGKRGKLVLHSQWEWIEAGGPYNIATGTWKVVRGTGQYARVTGGGRSAQVGSPSEWIARYQGYLTSP